MEYKVALFGVLLDEGWDPMKNSLYDHIEPHLVYPREWDELEGIFSKETGYVHVSLRSGKGG